MDTKSLAKVIDRRMRDVLKTEDRGEWSIDLTCDAHNVQWLCILVMMNYDYDVL